MMSFLEKVKSNTALALPSENLIRSRLPEWILFQRLVSKGSDRIRVTDLGHSTTKKYSLPLVGISIGSQDPEAPTLLLTGGVHGLERIGTQVILSFLETLTEHMKWDSGLQRKLESIRISFLPFVNPIGILERTRANPNGVDLMRNSPIEAEDKPMFLAGGHRYSPRLPWFRGNGELEVESKALIEFCRSQFFQSKKVVAVDFHSGFGVKDRLWFPYARSKKPFPHLAETHALLEKFEHSHPHHVYLIEPQAHSYTTHGDLWDYIYEEYRKTNTGVFLPLCLEMGSWNWLRKNPLQIFSILGPYNPMKPHRHKRILRRHWTLFDFLVRAIHSSEFWAAMNPPRLESHQEEAMARWYND